MGFKQRVISYFTDRSIFGWLFLLSGLVVQLVTFFISRRSGSSDVSWVSLVSGMTGVCAVVLCSQRRISSYFYTFIQTGTYVYLCFQQHFYGELLENLYYVVTMIIGVFIWKNHYDEGLVRTRRFTLKAWGAAASFLILGTLGLFAVLKLTNDTQPFMDSISTIPAFIAQMLLILRYREQWIFWFMIDVASTIMWAIAGDWCMTAQFVFWGMNCIYGYVLWGRASAAQGQREDISACNAR